jgi:hypothetical protein
MLFGGTDQFINFSKGVHIWEHLSGPTSKVLKPQLKLNAESFNFVTTIQDVFVLDLLFVFSLFHRTKKSDGGTHLLFKRTDRPSMGQSMKMMNVRVSDRKVTKVIMRTLVSEELNTLAPGH